MIWVWMATDKIFIGKPKQFVDFYRFRGRIFFVEFRREIFNSSLIYCYKFLKMPTPRTTEHDTSLSLSAAILEHYIYS